jgi:hypothetical protein
MLIWSAIFSIESPVPRRRTTASRLKIRRGPTNCVPSLGAVGLGSFHAGAYPLANQFSLELRHRREDVQQEFAGRIGFVRVESL